MAGRPQVMESLPFAAVRWFCLTMAAAFAWTLGPGTPQAALAVGLAVSWGLAYHFIPLHRRDDVRLDLFFFLLDLAAVAVLLLAPSPGSLWVRLPALGLAVALGLIVGRGLRAVPAGLMCGAAFLALSLVARGRWGLDPLPLGAAAAYLGLGAGMSAYGAELTRRVGRAAAFAREIGQRSRELKTLLEINDAVTSTLDLRQVMRIIVKRIGDQVEADRCSILLVDGQLHRCFVVAASDNPTATMLEVHLEKYPEIRKALETREPVVIEDVEHDPVLAPVRDFLVEHGYRSLMVVPLVFGQEVLGTLFLRATRGRPFRDEEIRFSKVAAGVCANALKNALLYREATDAAARHREALEKLRRLLDCSPDMIVATDQDGRITEFNRGAERITGRAAVHVLGKRIRAVLGEEAERRVTKGSGDTSVEHMDLRVARAEGGQVELSIASAPLTGEDGRVVGRVWVGRDMTRQRQVERRLLQAERLSSVGELAAGVAHELNNPLSAVLGYAQLLHKGSSDPGAARDLERIVEAARRCQRIIHNLLSFARKHPPEKKPHDLNECVRKVLELKDYHLKAAQVEVVCDLAPNLPKATFDFHQMEQVLLNLINNAEQALQGRPEPREIHVRTFADDNRLAVEVRDTGPGVPPQARSRIFDPFFTTKEVGRGTGLGLAVSYGIVGEHGGSIELADPGGEGRGATFRVFLPVDLEASEAAPEAAPEPAAAPDEAFHGRRILVAEDEPEVCALLARLLESEGAQVTVARDGLEAWERIAQANFDLIVADLRMPKLDGMALYEKVALERPELLRRFVFSTGDLVRQESVRFLESLPNRVLQKPLDIETVRRILARTLRRSRA